MIAWWWLLVAYVFVGIFFELDAIKQKRPAKACIIIFFLWLPGLIIGTCKRR